MPLMLSPNWDLLCTPGLYHSGPSPLCFLCWGLAPCASCFWNFAAQALYPVPRASEIHFLPSQGFSHVGFDISWCCQAFVPSRLHVFGALPSVALHPCCTITVLDTCVPLAYDVRSSRPQNYLDCF